MARMENITIVVGGVLFCASILVAAAQEKKQFEEADKIQDHQVVKYGRSIPHPIMTVFVGRDRAELIEIYDDEGMSFVKIKRDGKLEYGKNYDPDAAARIFWKALAKAYYDVCECPSLIGGELE